MTEITFGQVFGMRCSGTNHLDALVRENIPGLGMLPSHDTELTQQANLGWKHGDIGSRSYGINPQGRMVCNEVLPFTPADSARALLLVAYRSPFGWLRSLRQQPHHALGLYPDVTSFRAFLTQPWEAFASPPDEQFQLSPAQRLGYATRAHQFEAYPNVLAKRAAKIKLFESFAALYHNVTFVNHEQLRESTGAYTYLGQLATTYGLHQREPFVPVKAYKGYADRPYRSRQYPDMEPDDLRHVIETHDWEAEACIGYVLRDNAERLVSRPEVRADPDNLLEMSLLPRFYRGSQQTTDVHNGF